MGVFCNILLTKDAKNDLLHLDDKVYAEYLAMEEELRNNIHLGQPLKDKNGKDLSDCFKIYFDNYKHRIVYRKKGIDFEVVGVEKVPGPIAEIIAVGKRDKEQVYIDACKRLGR